MNYYNRYGNSSHYSPYQQQYGHQVKQEFNYQPQSQQLQYSIGSEDKRTQISNSDYSYWNNYNRHLGQLNHAALKKSNPKRKKKFRNRKAKKFRMSQVQSESSVIVISSESDNDYDSVHIIDSDSTDIEKHENSSFKVEHTSSSVDSVEEKQDTIKKEPHTISERYFTPEKSNIKKEKKKIPPSSVDESAVASTSFKKEPTLETNSNKRKADFNNNCEDELAAKKTKYNTEIRSDDKFSQQIEEFFKANQQQPKFLEQKLNLVSALEKAICRIINRTATLYIVGSSVNGFGRLTSDSDLCLVLNESTNDIGRKVVLNNLREIQRLLWKTPFANKISLIPARVPILKFYDTFGKIDCDLNINNIIGLRNTYLLLAYSMQDPRVQPLGLCIKEWAHQCGINDASNGSLSSYALILMVISYLQCGTSPPVLPSLQQMYPRHFSINKPLRNCEQAARSVPKFQSRNTSSHSELLVGFFRYFATEFDFRFQIVSIRLGKNIPISPHSNRRDMTQKPIKVEEPFDHSNVARAVNFKSRLIISKFKNAYNALLATHSDLRTILKLNIRKNTEDCFVID